MANSGVGSLVDSLAAILRSESLQIRQNDLKIARVFPTQPNSSNYVETGQSRRAEEDTYISMLLHVEVSSGMTALTSFVSSINLQTI